jgi:hypothetical protein
MKPTLRRPPRREMGLDNPHRRVLDDKDLRISWIRELTSLYDALSRVEAIWVATIATPRASGGHVTTICEEEADRTFEMMKRVAKELRDRKPYEDEVDDRRRILAHWKWKTGGGEDWS